jgi:hypothetical protein
LKANRLSPNSFVYPNQPARQINTRPKNQNKIHIIMAPPDKQAAAYDDDDDAAVHQCNSKFAGKKPHQQKKRRFSVASTYAKSFGVQFFCCN